MAGLKTGTNSEGTKGTKIMEKTYFVMLTSQDGEHVFPLKNEDEGVAMFATPKEARRAALTTPFAVFGFHVIDLEFCDLEFPE